MDSESCGSEQTERGPSAAGGSTGRSHDEITPYEDGWRSSPIGKDLRKVRNVKPLRSKLGTIIGAALGGLDMWANTLGFTLFGTLRHGKPDNATLRPATEFKPIIYSEPDGHLTFARLSSVFLSNTNHEGDQPVHLHVGDNALQLASARRLRRPIVTLLPCAPQIFHPSRPRANRWLTADRCGTVSTWSAS